MKLRLQHLLAPLVCLAIIGCNPAAEKKKEVSSAPEDRTLRLNVATEPETIDSSISKGIPEHKILLTICEPLVRLNAKAEAIPGAAERWEMSEDAKKWTFYLRKDGKWHNGDTVTARDFEYAVRRILDPATGGQYADFVYFVLKGGKEFYELKERDDSTPFEGVKVIDDFTIEYHMENPTPYFATVAAHTSFFPLNRKVVEAGGKNWANDPKTFAGNGAFTLAEWHPHDRMILKKADTYWDKENIWLDTVVIRMIEDENTELAAFESGEVDITDKVPLTEVDKLKATPDWYVGPYLGTYYVCFNTSAEPFNNVKLRQAFSRAIDRELIVTRITRRGEPIGTGIVPVGVTMPDGSDYRETTGDLVGGFDAAEARKLLAEAGFADPKSAPQFTYMYNTSSEHKVVGEQLEAMWRGNLGVTVKLENVEWKEKLRRGQAQQFEMMRSAWIGDYLDPITFLEIFHSKSGNNDGKFTNARYDELLGLARAESDWKKRREYLVEAEKILIGEAAVAPIFFYTNPRLVRHDFKGVVLNAMGNLDVTRAYKGDKK